MRVIKTTVVGAVVGGLALRGAVMLFENDPNNHYLRDRMPEPDHRADYILGSILGATAFGGLALATVPFRRFKAPK